MKECNGKKGEKSLLVMSFLNEKHFDGSQLIIELKEQLPFYIGYHDNKCILPVMCVVRM